MAALLANDDQVRQVQQATDLVALVGQHVRLHPRGKEFVGLCPFHDDTNPSLYVSPAKQIYKCFSCGAGGDALNWMINHHKMSFPEALRFLADRAGIALRPRPGGAGERDRAELAAIADANARALAFFRSVLQDAGVGRAARAYLEQRGISAEMAECFQLGYAPDRWDGLVQAIGRRGWDARAFRLAGLVSPRAQGSGDYDRLRHRLIFPICDNLGRPIAFGGRILPGGTLADPNEAKYLNSPETPLFSKSATLYGHHLARKPIIDSRVAVVVEGYTDVIACHQRGLTNVVATLGTALTPRHAALLRRLAERIILVFDADEAGQKASDRAVEIFLASGMDVAVAVLRAPDGPAGDPADLLARPDGVALWRQAIEGATDALTFQFERLRGRFEAAGTTAGRERIAQEHLRTLAELGLARQGLLRRALVLQKLADLLHMGAADVATMLQRTGPARATAGPSAGPGRTDTANTDGAASGGGLATPGVEESVPEVAATESGHRINALRMAERHLIGGLLHRPDLFHEPLCDGQDLAEALPASELVSVPARRLYDMIRQRLGQGGDLSLARLLADLAERDEQALCELATRAELEVERMTGADERKVGELVAAAARSLLDFRRQRRHRAACAGDPRTALAPGGTDDDDRLLRQVYDHQRAYPLAVRIGRVGH